MYICKYASQLHAILSEGYLTLWDVSKFLENQELDEGVSVVLLLTL